MLKNEPTKVITSRPVGGDKCSHPEEQRIKIVIGYHGGQTIYVTRCTACGKKMP